MIVKVQLSDDNGNSQKSLKVWVTDEKEALKVYRLLSGVLSLQEDKS